MSSRHGRKSPGEYLQNYLFASASYLHSPFSSHSLSLSYTHAHINTHTLTNTQQHAHETHEQQQKRLQDYRTNDAIMCAVILFVCVFKLRCCL